MNKELNEHGDDNKKSNKLLRFKKARKCSGAARKLDEELLSEINYLPTTPESYDAPPLSKDINDEPRFFKANEKAEAKYEKACEDVLDELQRLIDYCKEARITADQLIEQHRYWAKMTHDKMAKAIKEATS